MLSHEGGRGYGVRGAGEKRQGAGGRGAGEAGGRGEEKRKNN